MPNRSDVVDGIEALKLHPGPEFETDQNIALCSFYILRISVLCLQELDALVSQLPSPYLLTGDFNGHNALWGGTNRNAKGKIVEDFVGNHTLCMLNNGSHTYLHPAYGTQSAIAHTILEPQFRRDFSWRGGDDLCGSDHFSNRYRLRGAISHPERTDLAAA
jgi:hypothetical protein